MYPSTMTIDNDGTKQWKNEYGYLHRLDGPAIIDINGSEFWFINGKKHRNSGPAVIFSDGLQIWYDNNMIHRIDGPAMIDNNGKTNYYIYDHIYDTEEEYWDQINYINKIKIIIR